jgi:uncharacterized protein YfkK (UPF0435 family)
MANPISRGVCNLLEYNNYMNGYNSIKKTNENHPELEDIIKIVRRQKNIDEIREIATELSKLLVRSLEEPVDKKTETDSLYVRTLGELRKYDEEFAREFLLLYNAVQKSKRYETRESELVKILNDKTQIKKK